MTNLQAVNALLAAIGETPVDSIDSANPMLAAASAVLDAVHTRESARGWWFNTSATPPYPATTIAFASAPDSYAAYVTALAQVRFVKDYDGDESKAKFYGGEATLAASVVLADHLRALAYSQNSAIEAALTSLFRAAADAAGDDPAVQIQVLLGSNRVDRLITKTVAEMNTREQAQGWWFNTGAAPTYTVAEVAVAAAPAAFQEWVYALAAVRIALVYNAADSKVKQLRDEAYRAAAVVLTQHLNAKLASMDTQMAAATASLIRVAEESAGGPDALHRSIAMTGANRIDQTVAKALDEVNTNEQAHGWFFNTDDDGVITVLDLDDTDVPQTFLTWVTALAALRVAKVYNASQVKLQVLNEDAIAAHHRFMREHIKASAVNLQDTNALLYALNRNYGKRYRVFY